MRRMFSWSAVILAGIGGQSGAYGQCGIAAESLKAMNDAMLAATSRFGDTVDTDGTTLVVGAKDADYEGIEESGAAFVYTLVGGDWVFQQRLFASDASFQKEFGTSVAVSGDSIAVGAPNDEAVYIFTRSGTVWTQTAKIISPGQSQGQDDEDFGQAIDMTGTYLAVGSPGHDAIGINSNTGAVWMYLKSGSSWVLNPTNRIGPSLPQMQARYGTSVSLSGGDLIVGEPNRGSGRVSHYSTSTGTWFIEQTYVSPSGVNAIASFGQSVAIRGNTMVVGVPAHSQLSPPSPSSGAICIYTRSSTTSPFSIFQVLPAVNPTAGAGLGSSVAIAPSLGIVAGAPGALSAIHTFHFASGFWAEDERISPPVASGANAIGVSVTAADLSGGRIRAITGAGAYGNPPGFNNGAVFDFEVTSAGVAATQQILEPPALSHQMGSSVAISGDWAVVGVPFGDPPLDFPGQTAERGQQTGFAIVYRRVGGVWQRHSVLHESVSVTARFGASVAIDGTTIAVGAPYHDTFLIDVGSATDDGMVAVYAFDGTAWVSQAVLSNPAPLASRSGDLFGYAVDVSGNTLLVGVPGEDENGSNSGLAWTYTRSGSTWGDLHVVEPPDAAAGDEFGNAVALPGGTSLVVCAYGDDDLGPNSGSATLFSRTPIVGGYFWDADRKFVATDGQADDNFGTSVSAAGNVIVFGAPLQDTGGTSSGAIYIFRNTGLINPNWGTGTKVQPSGVSGGDRFGWGVATDGITVLAGSRRDDTAFGTNTGSAFSYRFVSGAWTPLQTLLAADASPESEFGVGVAISADAMVVGAPFDDNQFGTDAGAAYFFDTPLTVPSVTQQPVSVETCPGDPSVTFTVGVTGGGPFTFQWRKDLVNLVNGPGVSGATSQTLVLTNVDAADAGTYSCLIANACGSVGTAARTLDVCAADINCSGTLTVQDIFGFLAAYFSGSAAGNFNGVGGTTVQDIFDFLAAYFAGCA